MLKRQNYLFATSVLIVISSNQVCRSFDGLNYHIKPPKCTMTEIEARLKKNPKDSAALCDRAQSFLTAGECELAIADYSAVIKHSPTMAQSYLGRSRANEMIGNHELALRDIDQAIKIGDKTCLAECLLHKSAVLSALKRSAECPALIEQLLSRKDLGVGPDDRINLLEQRAQLYVKLGKPELAILDTKVCIQLRPNTLAAYLIQAKAYGLLNDQEKELAAYSHGIKQDGVRRGLSGNRLMSQLYEGRYKLYKKMGKLSLAEADRLNIKSHQDSLFKELYNPVK